MNFSLAQVVVLKERFSNAELLSWSLGLPLFLEENGFIASTFESSVIIENITVFAIFTIA